MGQLSATPARSDICFSSSGSSRKFLGHQCHHTVFFPHPVTLIFDETPPPPLSLSLSLARMRKIANCRTKPSLPASGFFFCVKKRIIGVLITHDTQRWMEGSLAKKVWQRKLSCCPTFPSLPPSPAENMHLLLFWPHDTLCKRGREREKYVCSSTVFETVAFLPPPFLILPLPPPPPKKGVTPLFTR